MDLRIDAVPRDVSGVQSLRGRDDFERGRATPSEAATAVEGLFVSMLVSEMKNTLESGGFFGSGPGSDVFDGMFERLMGEEIAKKGGFGLAAFVAENSKTAPGRENEDARASPHQDQDGKAELERTGHPPVTTP